MIEDPPTGVKAALTAGMEVAAVATLIPRERLSELERLPENHLVDDPGKTLEVVAQMMRRLG